MRLCQENDMKMQDVISLKVLTPENTICDKMVGKVSLPGSMGRFMVLKNHAPMISSLDAGTIVYESDGKEERLEVKEGFVEIIDNKVIVCAEV